MIGGIHRRGKLSRRTLKRCMKLNGDDVDGVRDNGAGVSVSSTSILLRTVNRGLDMRVSDRCPSTRAVVGTAVFIAITTY